MKITDEGLKVLSISRDPQYIEELDSYLIYEWKGVQYIAGLNIPEKLDENQVFIEVSESQHISISKEDTYASQISNIKDIEHLIQKENSNNSSQNSEKPPQAPPVAEAAVPAAPTPTATPAPAPAAEAPKAEGTTSLSLLSQITANYETGLLLLYDQTQNTFLLEDIVGTMKPKNDFKIPLKHASPFRIAFNSKQPFHGPYSPTDIGNQNLISCGINPQNLWITAYPLLDGQKVCGMLVGLSNTKNFPVSSLEDFETISFFAINMINEALAKRAA